MLDVEWSIEEVAEVTLVEVTVHNPTAVDRRVRVENRLDGPVLPPRTDGTPEAGWDADGYAGAVPADGRRQLGYASPAPPVEPPVAVNDEGRAAERGDAAAGAEGDSDAAEAVRLLGDAAPPVDALPSLAEGSQTKKGDGGVMEGERGDPTAADAEVSESVEGAQSAGRQDRTAADGPGSAVADGRQTIDATDERQEGQWNAGEGGDARKAAGAAEHGVGGQSEGENAPADAGVAPPRDDLPDPVSGWLADVERRVDHAERLTDASVVEAAAVLDERGGLSAVEPLPDRLADDEAALRALAERATALADRAAAVDVPVAALRRLS